MPKRRTRTNGEGSIFASQKKLKSGKVTRFWVAELEYLDRDRVTRRLKAQRPTQAEATRALHELRLRALDESRPAVTYDHRLVSEAVQTSLADTTLRIDAASVDTYRGILERHLLPHLGRRRADSIRRPDVVSWIATLRETGVGDRTIQVAYQRAKAILTPYVAHVSPAEHPFPLRGGPRVGEPEVQAWSPDHMRSFVLGVEGQPHAAALLLGLCCGLRQSEVRGLRWGDVDLANGNVRIVRSLSRATRAVKAPKTSSSMRTVRLADDALRALRHHEEAQREAGLGTGPVDAVFATSRRGVVSAPALYHGLQREAKRLGLPQISFHALRHTFATAALASGANPKAVQAVLGHADPALLLRRYGHVIPGAESEVADRISTLLRATNPSKPEERSEE